MKYVVISKLAPGVENTRKALDVFKKVGLPAGTEAIWAAPDGKTFINIVETDSPDMTSAATYAPFFIENTVIPVVAADANWLEAMEAAIANLD
jgi:hypothetical protein